MANVDLNDDYDLIEYSKFGAAALIPGAQRTIDWNLQLLDTQAQGRGVALHRRT